MLTYQENEPLAEHTTLQVGGPARFFVTVASAEELKDALAFAAEKQLPRYVLGGGSNVFFADAGYPGVVIKLALTGITYEPGAAPDTILLTAAAGENFDAVVADAVERGYWGLENLSHIPGLVGATPIQNVGAYGVEVSDIITKMEVFDCRAQVVRTLLPKDCAFGYRDSYFKQHPGEFIVLSVTYVLSTTPNPQLTYKDLAPLRNVSSLTPQTVRDAVIDIRSQKFPDWKEVGTAGSFFKNPIISQSAFAQLQETYPELPGFALSDKTVKVPAGWILDNVLGVRGEQVGAVGMYEGQSLVLVNHGGATAQEINAYASAIEEKVLAATGIKLEREVTFVDFDTNNAK